MTPATPPMPLKTSRRQGEAKRKIIGQMMVSPHAPIDGGIKPATRSKAGCMTCRIRRKKCDLERDSDSCQTCKRLRIECLGWGAKRPDALRDPRVVKECQNMIKLFLASNNMIKGSARSAAPAPGQPLPNLHLSPLLKRPPSCSFPIMSCGPPDVHRCTLAPIRSQHGVSGMSQPYTALPPIYPYVVQVPSPSSSSSANAGGGGAGDAGQPSYIGASFLMFDNLKRDDYGTFEPASAYPPPPTRKRPAQRKPKARQVESVLPAEEMVEDEDADGSGEDYDEDMGDRHDYGPGEAPSSFSRHPPPYPPPPATTYDQPQQYRTRYSYQNPPPPHQSPYHGAPAHPYAQSSVRTSAGSYDHERKPSLEDNFRELERERERDMDHHHYRPNNLHGPPPSSSLPHQHQHSYPPPPHSHQHEGPPYQLPHRLVYGPGVGAANSVKDYSGYGHTGYRGPSPSSKYSSGFPPPIHSDPYGQQSSRFDQPRLPMIQTLPASPGVPMSRTSSYNDRSPSYAGSPELAAARGGGLNHMYSGNHYAGSTTPVTTVNGNRYPGEVEMEPADLDGEPMPTSQTSVDFLKNPYLPSGSSFGTIYQFDALYSDAELGVASNPSSLVPAATTQVMDVAGSMDQSQFNAVMAAINMNMATGTDFTSQVTQVNLDPSGITALEQFHNTVLSPAPIINPTSRFDVSLQDGQMRIGFKQLELLYMYRGELCKLQYHIAHSTDASIADDLFNIAIESDSARYGTLTLTSLFKIRTRVNNNADDLTELQFFKDKVAQGLGQKMQNPDSVDSGDAMAGLHMVSAILFEGGTNAQWDKFLDVAKLWVEKHPIMRAGSWKKAGSALPAPDGTGASSDAQALTLTRQDMWMDKKNAFIIKATAWFDVIGSVTMRRTPRFLSTYRELFGNQGGAAMERIMGCDEKVLLAIAETAALAEWRHDMERQGCLSFMDLASRAAKIEQSLQFIGPVYSGVGFVEEEPAGAPSPNSTIDEVDEILGMASAKSGKRRADHARSAHRIRLVSNVFRAAGKLYLHTVVSQCNPDVKEIKDAVAETVTAFGHLEQSDMDRSLVFPIALAGCLTDSQAHRHYLVGRLKALGKEGEAVGNTKSCLQLMQAVWKKRDNGGPRKVDWIDTMKEMGWSLLLA